MYVFKERVMYMQKDDLTYNLTNLKIIANKKNSICLIGWIYFGFCISALIISESLIPLYFKGLSVGAGDILDVQKNLRNEFYLSLLPLIFIVLRYWYISRSYNKLENKIEKGL